MGKRAIVIWAAILSGCAGPRMYSDPTADLGSYSRITIDNAARLPLSARLYDDALSCSGPVKLLEKSRAFYSGEAKTFYAKRGAPVTIGAWYAVGVYTGYSRVSTQCDLNTTFVPTADSYRITYDAEEGAARCRVVATEQNGGQSRPVDPGRLFVRPFNLAFLNDGPWCKALSDAQVAAIDAGRSSTAP